MTARFVKPPGGAFSLTPLAASEAELLWYFLYLAIFVPPGAPAPALSILEQPQISRYVKGFGGQPGDLGLLARLQGRPVGAAWTRILEQPSNRGYGYAGPGIPELSISVLPAYRGQGLGTCLLQQLHQRLQWQGYQQVSLSVQPANPARHLYERLGYRCVRKKPDDWLLLWQSGAF
ncbi:GNAT family N-acetyltransferase [Oscillospiraceae bacterium HV4-5-C5C]|nr:GNAT family N-acetyltransferase [Oscillospiraceae bacterium HV4-5-C5C]